MCLFLSFRVAQLSRGYPFDFRGRMSRYHIKFGLSLFVVTFSWISDLYTGVSDSFGSPQSKYVIVLHSDLLSRVVHFDEPPFLYSKKN